MHDDSITHSISTPLHLDPLHLSTSSEQRMVTSLWVKQCLLESHLCDLQFGWDEIYADHRLGMDSPQGKSSRKRKASPQENEPVEASTSITSATKTRRRTLRRVKPAERPRFEFTAAVLTQWRGTLREFFTHVDGILSTRQSSTFASAAVARSTAPGQTEQQIGTNSPLFSTTSSFFRKYRHFLEPCFNSTMIAHLAPHAHRKVDKGVACRRQGNLNTPLNAANLEQWQKTELGLDAWRKNIGPEPVDDIGANAPSDGAEAIQPAPVCDEVDVDVDVDANVNVTDNGHIEELDIPTIDDLESLLRIAFKLSAAGKKRNVIPKAVVERLLSRICQTGSSKAEAERRSLHVFGMASARVPIACGRAMAIRPWYLPLVVDDSSLSPPRDESNEHVAIMLYYLSPRPCSSVPIQSAAGAGAVAGELEHEDQRSGHFIVDGGEIWTVGVLGGEQEAHEEGNDARASLMQLVMGVWGTLAGSIPHVEHAERQGRRRSVSWRDFEWPLEFLHRLANIPETSVSIPLTIPLDEDEHDPQREWECRIERIARRPDPLLTDQDKAQAVLAALL